MTINLRENHEIKSFLKPGSSYVWFSWKNTLRYSLSFLPNQPNQNGTAFSFTKFDEFHMHSIFTHLFYQKMGD